MRLMIDLFVGINAAGGVIGFALRRLRRNRRQRAADELSHQEYQRQLADENIELDRNLERIDRRQAW